VLAGELVRRRLAEDRGIRRRTGRKQRTRILCRNRSAQKTIGHADYILREITIRPAGNTGWPNCDGTLVKAAR
jgi:hypothetical protein